MDHRQFFEELKACYRLHGLPFPYDFEKSVAKHCRSNIISITHHALAKNVSKGHESKKWAYSKSAASRQNSYKERFYKSLELEKILAKNQFSSPRFFFSVEGMVYTLAWELSCAIGRLPDALHARMVFSLDGHSAIRRYIEKHGV